MRLIHLENSIEIEEIIQIKGHRFRDPRREKERDYRSGGHRRWPSMNGRYARTAYGNFLQQEANRKMRHMPLVDTDGEGIIPVNHKTVDWELW